MNMDTNMSGFKRRLNKAMVECRSQASCLVGQMRPAQQKATGKRPHFSYNFAAQDHLRYHQWRVRQPQPSQQQQQHQHQQRPISRQPAKQPDNSCQMSSATASQTSDRRMDQEDKQIYSNEQDSMDDDQLNKKAACYNGNLKSSDHFVRAGSRRRSSTRHRRSARNRQVRFQPIPQAIDISIQSSDSSIQQSNNELQQTIRRRDFDQDPSGDDELARSNGVVNNNNNNNKKTTRRITLNVKQCRQMKLPSTKPLTKKLHHLSHIRFNKIKLMSFNNLVHQLHQTLASGDSFKPSSWKVNSSSMSCDERRQQQQQHEAMRQDETEWLNDGEQVADEEDEYGWGSDFDDQSGGGSSNDESVVCREEDSSPSAGYLLEIGKSSADSRAIDDVIQDRGISGQFKRIECSSEASPVKPTNQQALFSHKLKIELERRMIHDTLQSENSKKQEAQPTTSEIHDEEPVDDDNDDDEEAELRSLEARQGFKQIRDKLKVILDQRLASYEATCSSRQSQQVAVTKETSSGQTKDRANLGAVQKVLPSAQTDTKPAEYDDCQSHCSDESSSSGLDSNHSGSQDSGHSTQHSGYSTCRHQLETNRAETSPVESMVSQGVSHDSGKSSSVSPLNELPSPSPPDQVATQPSREDPSSRCKAEDEQRRARFMQNRLIINSKLESMIKSRSETVSASKTAPNSPQKAEQPSASKRAISSQALLSVSPLTLPGDDCPAASSSQSSPAEAALRLQLLEQQRQMSIKLKQKPRRKTVQRAFQMATGSSTENNGSYASSSSYLQRPSRDSLTKQLSMVCLRQTADIDSQASRPVSHEVPSPFHQSMSLVGAMRESTMPQATQSLRQLVKEVIDDCERPSKLSTLTKSIMNRSDSLCSDLDSNPSPEIDANSSSIRRHHHHHHRRAIPKMSEASDSSRALSSSSSLDCSSPPIGHQRQMTMQQVEGNSQRYADEQRYCLYQDSLMAAQIGTHVYPIQQQQQQQQQQQHHSTPQQVAADLSFSSVGTIDGLEYSRSELPASFDELTLVEQSTQLDRPVAGSSRQAGNTSGNKTLRVLFYYPLDRQWVYEADERPDSIRREAMRSER